MTALVSFLALGILPAGSLKRKEMVSMKRIACSLLLVLIVLFATFPKSSAAEPQQYASWN